MDMATKGPLQLDSNFQMFPVITLNVFKYCVGENVHEFTLVHPCLRNSKKYVEKLKALTKRSRQLNNA